MLIYSSVVVIVYAYTVPSYSIFAYSHPCHAPVLPYIYLLLYNASSICIHSAAPPYQGIYIHRCICS